jgi:type IV pilus assembly protein PilB
MVEVLRERLGDVLVKEGVITKDELAQAVELQKKKGGTLPQRLVELGFVTEDEIVVSLGEQLGVPHIRLSSYNIDPEVIQLIPEATARQYHLIALSKVGNTLTVVMSDPLNVFAIDDVKFLTGCDVEAIVSTESDIVKAIDKYYGSSRAQIAGLMGDIAEDKLEMIRDDDDELDLSQLQSDMEDAPLIRLVDMILINAIKERASDVHIEPTERAVGVRYRIDGDLREVTTSPKAVHPALVSRLKVMSNLDIAERRLPQDGRTRMRYQGREVDFRVSTLPTTHGEKVVLRVLDKMAVVMRLSKLGYDEVSLKRFQECLQRPHGMILLTGPTSSGKSTTLYAALQELNNAEVNIVTVEDPVEYQLDGINQVQVKPDIGLTFAAGLRSILRQDPDIIMVGEMRDHETADTAVKSALTGHLVLSTLHTNDAAGAMTRLVDMGVEPFLIASSTIMVGAQRLIKNLCRRCAEPYALPPEAAARLRLDPEDEHAFHRPVGCKRCNNTGYFGRSAVLEILVVDEDVQNLVITAASAPEIKRAARRNGMYTLRENALMKAKAGVTSIEEVLRVTEDDQDPAYEEQKTQIQRTAEE